MFHGFHLPTPFKLSLLDLTTLFFASLIIICNVCNRQSAISNLQPFRVCSLPDVVRASQITAFADDTKFSKK